MNEALLRELAPRATAILTRRLGRFDRCEDAVQEALLAAARQWPRDGRPEEPLGWLLAVAARRWTDMARQEDARTRREAHVARLEPAPAAEPPGGADAEDDTLTMLLLCCHPALTVPSQVALTLRAVGGLTTAEIARAMLTPEAAVGQRIARAKARIRAAGARFALPPQDELEDRVGAVRHVLSLVFSEGSTASSGAALHRVGLSAEALRLTRRLHAARPRDGEVTGLLALMLLTDARRPARTTPDGALVPLAEQDRGLWDRALIAEGAALIVGALAAGPVGPFQLQAAIAAVHAEAASAEETDWHQVLALYGLLEAVAPGPMVALNRVVAQAMVHGPAAGLAALDRAARDPALAEHHRLHAVRAHLLERAGRTGPAAAAYARAAQLTLSVPEQRYLRARAARLR